MRKPLLLCLSYPPPLYLEADNKCARVTEGVLRPQLYASVQSLLVTWNSVQSSFALGLRFKVLMNLDSFILLFMLVRTISILVSQPPVYPIYLYLFNKLK